MAESCDDVSLDHEEKDDNKKKGVILLLIAIAVATVVVLLLYNYFTSGLDDVKKEPEGEVWYDNPFDPSMIPTYFQVDEIMERVVEDTYGEDFWQTGSIDEDIQIPGTEITMTYDGMTDNRDLVSLTLHALEQNPYAINDMMPAEFQRLANIPDGSIRELHDGQLIDLARLEEHYDRTKVYNNRDNPLHVKLTGYRNGDWYEDIVDLSRLYQTYYEGAE